MPRPRSPVQPAASGWRRCPGPPGRTKYLFLKNPWNLTPQQKQRLAYLEKFNLKINRAYLLKELFRQLWFYPARNLAAQFLEKWLGWAERSGLIPLRRFARMVRMHLEGILAYFHFPLDNGRVEAMNNNAKQISHRAHGFRTASTFIDNLYHCLGKLPLQEMEHKYVIFHGVLLVVLEYLLALDREVLNNRS
jgi:transposase